MTHDPIKFIPMKSCLVKRFIKSLQAMPRMMLSLLAYNFTNWLRTLVFPEGQKQMQIQTIRKRLVKVASKIVKSGRSLYFKLSSSFVY